MPHLNYGDVAYDLAFSELFRKSLEAVQYNTSITLAGVKRGTFYEKLFEELDLES